MKYLKSKASQRLSTGVSTLKVGLTGTVAVEKMEMLSLCLAFNRNPSLSRELGNYIFFFIILFFQCPVYVFSKLFFCLNDQLNLNSVGKISEANSHD